MRGEKKHGHDKQCFEIAGSKQQLVTQSLVKQRRKSKLKTND
jgi:hypothetical protein